jgi:hypothetical protein
MIIKLTNIDDIEKRKNKISKQIKPLLATLYKNIANDNKKIINKYNSIITKEVFIKEHKQDIQSILKTIYRKVFKEFGYDTRVIINKLIKEYVFNIQKGEKQKKDSKIEEDFDEKSLLLINKKAEEHSNFIINTLYNKSVFYHEQANKDINTELTDNKKKLINLQTQISLLLLQNASSDNAKTISDLKKQINILNKRTIEIENNFNNIVANEFYDAFNENVVDQLAILESNQEVGFAESAARQLELMALAQSFTQYAIKDKTLDLKNSFIKEWDATLDKNTRLTHANAHGQQVKMNEKFVVNNPINGLTEYGDAPRAESFSLENKINCRCIMIIYMKLF